MIKPVLGSSYRQYILSLWLPFYLSLPTLAVSYALGIVLKGQSGGWGCCWRCK